MATRDNDVVGNDKEVVPRDETSHAEVLPENVVSGAEATKEVPQCSQDNGAQNDNTIIKDANMKGMVSVYKTQSEKTAFSTISYPLVHSQHFVISMSLDFR